MKLPFAKKTVASVTAGLQSLVDDLAKVREDSLNEAKRHDDEVLRLEDRISAEQSASATAMVEAHRASRVAAKITEILDA